MRNLQILMNEIIQGMLLLLGNSQMGHLLEVLNCALFGYEVKKSDSIEDENIKQKDFCTEKVPKNAVEWAFFGTFWCLGGV